MINWILTNVRPSDLEQIGRILDGIAHILAKILAIVVFISAILGVIYTFYYMIVLGNLFTMM